MTAIPAHKKAAPPSEREKEAILRLLGDENPVVHAAVRQKILALGPSAVDWLKPHTLCGDRSQRQHARQYIEHFQRQSADDRFLAFCLTEGNDLNLEEGAWLLAQTKYPDTSIEAYKALLDTFAGELLEMVDLRADADLLLGSFNHYLFEVLNFHGNEQNYYDPQNSYLCKVIDRRTGNPINLCLVYLMLARRLRLPITGIGLPGHFLCRYQSPTEEYYIDVFNRGKLWTKANCVRYLLSKNYSVSDDHLTPISSRQMLLRICANLHQIYQRRAESEEVTRLQRYMVALSKQQL